MAQACERFGGLNLLINNASSFYPTPLGTITLAQWQDLMGTNLQAPLFLAQAAAPPLKASRGAMINIVDIHGLRPLRDHVVYSIAKAGLIMLTRALARELAPEVRVNGIAPGAVLWPETGMDEERKERILEQTPLHRPGSPADIARAVLFFAADARSSPARSSPSMADAASAGELSWPVASRRIQIRLGGGHGVFSLRKRPRARRWFCAPTGCSRCGASSASGPSM